MAGSFSSEFSAEFDIGQSGSGDYDFMPISPTASVSLSVSPVSSRVQIPTSGTPVNALITNYTQWLIFLAFGDNTVVAPIGGIPLMPNSQIAVTIGTFTYVAAIGLNNSTTINITTYK